MPCYAAHLGNCRGDISKEHYVSESVLEIAGSVVQVSGFPWQEANKSMRIGIGSLTSKILCEHHNSQLSSLDGSGRSFLQALKSSFDDAMTGEFPDEIFYLNGDKIELWLLKILCGVLTVTCTAKVPDTWVNILFERDQFPDEHGLYVFGQPGVEAAWYFNLVRIISVLDKNRRIAGARFGIGGLALLLAFGKPIFWEAGFSSIHRPEFINITKDTKTKVLKLSWERHSRQGTVNLDISGRLVGQNFQYKPIVSPEFGKV